MNKLLGLVINQRYHVQEYLGRGGLADVYKVWDTKKRVYLAAKLLRQDLAQDSVFMRWFQQEIEVLNKLQHPNIVRFYGIEQFNHLTFILMDYIDGDTLKEIIRYANGPIHTNQILAILSPIISALSYVHGIGEVHGNIKTSNIIIHKNSKVYLTDFGIAPQIGTGATLADRDSCAYMAPEIIRGFKPSPVADIYALGIVLYEMLTGGRRPFTGEKANITGTDDEKIRWEQINLVPVSPKYFNPEISANLEWIILKCLSKDPADRYPSVTALWNDIVAAIGSRSVTNAASNKSNESDRADLVIRAAKPKAGGLKQNVEYILIGLGVLLVLGVMLVSGNQPARTRTSRGNTGGATQGFSISEEEVSEPSSNNSTFSSGIDTDGGKSEFDFDKITCRYALAPNDVQNYATTMSGAGMVDLHVLLFYKLDNTSLIMNSDFEAYAQTIRCVNSGCTYQPNMGNPYAGEVGWVLDFPGIERIDCNQAGGAVIE